MNSAAYPWPASTFESPIGFAISLFTVVLLTTLSAVLARKQIVQMWHDRSYGYDAVWALNAMVLAFCIVSILGFSPEIVYLISYAEASMETREAILTGKRVCYLAAVVPFIFWCRTFLIWRPEIILRLRDPRNRVWNDSKAQGSKLFFSILGGAAGLAICVTLGRLFS